MQVMLGLLAVGSVFLTAACSPTTPDVTPTDETPTATDTPTETDTPSPTPTLNAEKQTLTSFSAISVTGDFNTAPTVTAPYPFNVDKSLCETTITGTGIAVGDASVVELQYTGINGSDGQTFDTSFSTGQTLLGQNGYFVTGFNNCLTGAKVGSRVVMLVSGPDGYDSQGGQSDAGIAVGDTLLFVVDIIAAEYTHPDGQHLADGNQWANVTDKDGVPTITLVPDVTAPTELQSTVLTQGTGRAVATGDAVYVNFIQMDLATGEIIQNSYTDGGGPQADLLANLIPGWRESLVGQTMGSRLLLVVPGSMAYPQGNASPSVTPNATLVFVVDILFSWVPQQQSS